MGKYSSSTIGWVKLPDGSDATMIETSRGRYHWKPHPIHRLGLFSESDLVNPLVYVEMGSTMSLVLESVTAGFQKQIIASFLTLKQKSCMEGKWTSIADGKAQVLAVKSLFRVATFSIS
ncbi:hypothetical protein H2248_005831 [Termitomyces sp. 'cryptogamus']|nr:hypothetical protein H2248_005831 [Termitomyces sp. 'cryptogamus']